MRHVHPFPARMAPELAINRLADEKKTVSVLDPMCGSGMVLRHASAIGLESYGYDIDPLAVLISKVSSSDVGRASVVSAVQKLVSKCLETSPADVFLPWMDECQETLDFVNFWFGPKQIQQLRVLSYFLNVEPVVTSRKLIMTLKTAVSRLIITKEPKASFARDTAHSRPHRTITENNFDVVSALPASVESILRCKEEYPPIVSSKVFLGDARRMRRTQDSTIKLILSSPPYANAIDYMRGHKLSLIWFGYSIPQLRSVRSRNVGAERSLSGNTQLGFEDLASELGLLELPARHVGMLERYYLDLIKMTAEASRVLMKSGRAVYVIGNSNLSGVPVPNNELLRIAAARSGLKLYEQFVREIPANRRYMPISKAAGQNLAKRMKSEFVMEFGF